MKTSNGFISLGIALILVVVIGVAVFSGIGYFSRKPSAIQNTGGAPVTDETNSSSALPGTNVNPSASSTTKSGVQTYTNTKYGFSFQYPGDAPLRAQDMASEVFTNPESAIMTFTFYSSNGYALGGISIETSADKSITQNCLTVPVSGGGTSFQNRGITTINSVPFSTYTYTSSTAGRQTKNGTTYTALHNGRCYAVSSSVLATSLDDLKQSGGSAPYAELTAKLDAVAQSFEFTK